MYSVSRLGKALNILLLTHHSEEDLDRCFRFRCRHTVAHLCARCSGVVIGGIGWMCLNRGLPYKLIPVFAVIAVLDWVLDALLGWKANNAVRFLSGCILGVIQIENHRYFFAGCFPIYLIVANLICLAGFLTLIVSNGVAWFCRR